MCLLGRRNTHASYGHGDLFIEVCVGGIRAKEKHLPFSEITDNWKFHILTSSSYLSLKHKTDEFQPSNSNQYSTLTHKCKQKFLFYFPKYFALQLKAKFKIMECILSFPIQNEWFIALLIVFLGHYFFSLSVYPILVESYCPSQQIYSSSFLNLYPHCWHTAKGAFPKSTYKHIC